MLTGTLDIETRNTLWTQVTTERLEPSLLVSKLYALRESSEGAEQRRANELLRINLKRMLAVGFDSDLYNMLEDAYRIAGAYDFQAFVEFLEWDQPLENRFFYPRRQALAPAVKAIQDLADDRSDAAIISMPPRIGKTTLGLLACVWMGARQPARPILLAAYSTGLAHSFYEGCLGFIAGRYRERFRQMFPQAAKMVNTHAKDLMLDLGDYRRYKTLSFRSIDGTITGAVEAEQLLYMDDLVSGIEEALNKERLDKLWMKVTDDLFSRMKTNCKILMIGTHWSVHDPIMRLKELYADRRITVVSMPAVDKDGESNFDYQGGFSTRYYEAMKLAVDEVSWSCMFMQEPLERDGILFPAETLQYYFNKPTDVAADMILASCDVSEGRSDSFCFPVGYIYGNFVYIEDVVFSDRLPAVVKYQIAEKIKEHKPNIAQFESNSGGDAFAENVKELIPDERTVIRKKRTTTNKETRIYINSDYIKKNFLFKDPSMYDPKSEYATFMRGLVTYAYKGTNSHDDAPDGLTMLAELIATINRKTGQVTPISNPFWSNRAVSDSYY